MAAPTAMAAPELPNPEPKQGGFDFSELFSAWAGPTPPEPSYDELIGAGRGDGLDDALDLRILSL